jgi:hypothetical protein
VPVVAIVGSESAPCGKEASEEAKMRKDQLEAYFDNANLPQSGRRYVRDSILLSPVRDARGGNTSVPTDVYSNKGSSAQNSLKPRRLESRTVEYAVGQMYEADTQVLEWYAQPIPLDVTYTHPLTNKTVRWQHTPDFLLLCIERPLIEEWKGLSWLHAQLKSKPGRYQFNHGVWFAPPVEEAAETLGIAYRLRTHDDVPHILAANTKFLLRYMSDEWPSVEGEKLKAIQEAFNGSPYIKFSELLKAGSGRECIDQDLRWELDDDPE